MSKDMYRLFPESGHETILQNYFGNEGFDNVTDFSGSFDKESLIVCFTNRCGSTYLISLLMQYGIASEPNEYMNFEYFNGDEVVKICRNNEIKTFDSYIEHVFSNYSKDGRLITKLSVDQLVMFSKKGYLKKYFGNAKFLFIERRDLISQSVSLSIAMQSGLWTSKHEAVNKKELNFDLVALRNYCKQIANSNAYFKLFFELHDIDTINVVYEELLKDEDSFRRSLEEFLGVKFKVREKNELKLKKQGTEINEIWKKQIRNMYSSLIK